MKNLAFSALAVLLCLSLTVPTAFAQRGGGGRGGRGGDRGERGGDRGGRGGGDRGSRGFGGGDRGGSRGFGGGDRGSRGGGFGGRGGDRGGDRGGRSFDPSQAGSRIAGYFDKNKDGRLDSGELQSMPSSFRDRFASGGIDMSRGISVADFGKKASEAIKQRMEQRERERGGDDRDRDRGRDRDSRDRNSQRQTVKTSKPIFKLSEREKVRATLPDEYVDGDADKDGQIALFEWAAWKRSDMFAFFELDENADGFLTPRELMEERSYLERGVVQKKQRLTIVGGSSSAGVASRVRVAGQSSSSRSSSNTKRSAEQVDRDKGRGEYYFNALDRDRDGKVSSEEWERSRIVRGMFERAKLPIGSMDKSTFVANYLKAAAASGSTSSDPRQRWGGGNTSGRGSSNWGGRDRGRSDRGR